MEEAGFRELFYIFKKRLKPIILLTITSLVLSGIINFFIITPKYETFTTLMIGKSGDYRLNNSGIDYNDVLLNEKLVHTYSELVKSRAVSDRVIQSLNLEISYEEFQGKVQVDLVNDTEIIKIQVKDPDKELAATIANEVSEQFIETVKLKMKVENVQIIDKAAIPQNPVSPKKFLNMVIGTVLGFMVGVFLTFLLEYLDNTFKTPSDIERTLHLPVLGTIPIILSGGKETIVRNNPKSPISEAFRTMRTNIQFTNIDKDIKTLAITSSTMAEGKSTVVSNLAISIAQEEKKVLIVDCDLRKPRIHKIFSVPNTQGLTSILMGASTIEDTVYKQDGMKNLYVITSGPIPPNPSELLSSRRMKGFLEAAKEEYDMIILDTPPIGLVTDAAILSTSTDAVLLVIQAGKAEISQVEYAKELLNKVNAKIIGTVLNKVAIKDGKYGDYQYDQYYSYYGEDA